MPLPNSSNRMGREEVMELTRKRYLFAGALGIVLVLYTLIGKVPLSEAFTTYARVGLIVVALVTMWIFGSWQGDFYQKLVGEDEYKEAKQMRSHKFLIFLIIAFGILVIQNLVSRLWQ